MVVGDTRGGALDILHQAIEIVAGIGNCGNANGGTIPYWTGFEFRDGDVEAGAYPVLQAADDLAFILEGLRGFDVDFEGEEGDQGAVSSVRFLVSSIAAKEQETGNQKLETRFTQLLPLQSVPWQTPRSCRRP